MKLLNNIQQKLKAPKGQRNSFGNYNYRSCEDILTAVKPLLEEGVLLLTDEVVDCGGRVFLRATATLKSTELHSESSVDVEVTAVGLAEIPTQRKGMDASQITGCASSYARKYALNGLFCIDDTKDADTDEQANQTNNNQEGAW